MRILLLIFILISQTLQAEEYSAAEAKGFLDRGIESYKYKDYDNALINFMQCNKVLIDCIHNTGATYYVMNDHGNAIEWFNLSARYGFKKSINALKAMEVTAPEPDLAQNKNNQGQENLSAAFKILNSLINGYNRGAERRLNNGPRNASCTVIGNTVDCYQY